MADGEWMARRQHSLKFEVNLCLHVIGFPKRAKQKDRTMQRIMTATMEIHAFDIQHP
jgi:hypothetical protein